MGHRPLNVINVALLILQMLSIPFNPYTWDNTKQRVNSNVLALADQSIKSLKQRHHRYTIIKPDDLLRKLTVFYPA